MTSNYLNELKYDPLRGKVISPRGEIEIKEYKNGGKYVNYKGAKVSLGNISVFNYNKPDLNTVEGWQMLYEQSQKIIRLHCLLR